MIGYHVFPDGKIRMLFMTPSDPDYGGTSPQLPKGQIDPGEDFLQAAIREGTEEVGLEPSNYASKPFKVGEFNKNVIHIVEIKDPKVLLKPHFETGSVHWLTNEEFARVGRDFQRPWVNKAYEQILLQLIFKE